GVEIRARAAQAERRGADGVGQLRDRPGGRVRGRPPDPARGRARGRGRRRDRRRQHLARVVRQRQGDGPRHCRLHGDGGDGPQRPGVAGRPRKGGRPHPGDDRDPDAGGCRAVHPTAGDPPHGERAGGDPGRRDRQPLLYHRHRRRPARPGAGREGAADGEKHGRRRLHRRPAAGQRCHPLRPDQPPGSARTQPAGDGRLGAGTLPRQSFADSGLQHAGRRGDRARRARGAGRHPGRFRRRGRGGGI
ncbi:MAG: Uridine monophosphate kinase, partial [uncultured Thermomicrobiales bacterium]